MTTASQHTLPSRRRAVFAKGRRQLGRSTSPMMVRRVLTTVPLLFVVTALSFVLVSLTPGDATSSILGVEGSSPEAVARLRSELGLDLPIYQQYWNWASDAATGDFGNSVISGQSVSSMIDTRLGPTVSLIFGALLVSSLLGVWLGVLSAVRGGLLGKVVDGFALIGFSVPAFWAGALLIAVFAVKLGWLPPTGYVPFSNSPRGWIESLSLPVTALALPSVAAVSKQTREAMLDTLASEYIRMARATGIPSRSIVGRHALKNAATRSVTILGLQAVGLVGGTVVVENVFAVPGLGWLAVNSVVRGDLPVVLGVVVCFTAMVVAMNLVVDLSYTWLNPKVRTR